MFFNSSPRQSPVEKRAFKNAFFVIMHRLNTIKHYNCTNGLIADTRRHCKISIRIVFVFWKTDRLKKCKTLRCVRLVRTRTNMLNIKSLKSIRGVKFIRWRPAKKYTLMQESANFSDKRITFVNFKSPYDRRLFI